MFLPFAIAVGILILVIAMASIISSGVKDNNIIKINHEAIARKYDIESINEALRKTCGDDSVEESEEDKQAKLIFLLNTSRSIQHLLH